MKKFINVLGVATVALTLTSCLKDKPINSLEYGMINHDKQKIVELAAPPDHLISFAMDFVDKVEILDMAMVNIAADKPVTEDVVVTVSIANTATMIADYNTANGTHVVQLPASFYTLQGSGLSVTVPAGSRMAAVKAAVNAINFDPSTTYAVGFTITAVDKQGYTVSGNFGRVLVLFGAKNIYDGLYEITGTLTDANGVYIGDYGDPAFPREYELITVSAVSGVTYDRSWDYPYYIVINASTGGAATTNIRPRLTFDPNTNVITAIDNVGTSTAVTTVQPGSKYNPGDGSIDVKWVAGRWNVNEHWEYIGPR